jgi:hypothetical protein
MALQAGLALVQRMHDQLKIMAVKIKPRHCPNSEVGGIHYIGDFKELSQQNFRLDIQNEQETSTP